MEKVFLKKIIYSDKIWQCAISKNQEYFAFSQLKSMYLLDLKKKCIVGQLHIDGINQYCFSEDSCFLWTINVDSVIRVYDTRSFDCIFYKKLKRYADSTKPLYLYKNQAFFRSVTHQTGQMRHCICRITMDGEAEVFLIAENDSEICCFCVSDEQLHLFSFENKTSLLHHQKKDLGTRQECTFSPIFLGNQPDAFLKSVFLPEQNVFAYVNQTGSGKPFFVSRVIPVKNYQTETLFLLDLSKGKIIRDFYLESNCQELFLTKGARYLCVSTRMRTLIFDAQLFQLLKSADLDLTYFARATDLEDSAYVVAGDDFILFQIIDELQKPVPLIDVLDEVFRKNKLEFLVQA